MLDGNSRAIQASLCETETVNQMLTLKKWEEESTVGVWSHRISRQKPVLLFQLTYLSFFFFLHFTILYWFGHTSTCICHGCTCVPHSEPSSHHPPHTIPLGHRSAPAPSFLYPETCIISYKKRITSPVSMQAISILVGTISLSSDSL